MASSHAKPIHFIRTRKSTRAAGKSPEWDVRTTPGACASRVCRSDDADADDILQVYLARAGLASFDRAKIDRRISGAKSDRAGLQRAESTLLAE
jgi:hypothetical protein